MVAHFGINEFFPWELQTYYCNYKTPTIFSYPSINITETVLGYNRVFIFHVWDIKSCNSLSSQLSGLSNGYSEHK